MAVAGTSPQLQCVACPSQNITCQCVAHLFIVWSLDSEFIVVVTNTGEIFGSNASYTVTVEQLGIGLSSNLSLIAGPVTVQCEDFQGVSNWSYRFVGTFLEIVYFPMCQAIKYTASFSCNTEPPGPPVINMVTALNNFSARLSSTPPPYNCSLNYILEVADEENLSVVFWGSTKSTTINVTALNIGKTYSFRVASVDADERMSNWSHAASLISNARFVFVQYNHKFVSK